jgi:hypothetical protein
VLVSEVFGSSVINELVIPTLEHAHAQLLQPGAMVVPKAASARAYLAGGPELEGNLFVDRAAGFTISAMNDFAVSKMGLDVSHVPHDVLSEDFEVFRFDLTQPSILSEKRVIDAVAVRSGRCFGWCNGFASISSRGWPTRTVLAPVPKSTAGATSVIAFRSPSSLGPVTASGWWRSIIATPC